MSCLNESRFLHKAAAFAKLMPAPASMQSVHPAFGELFFLSHWLCLSLDRSLTAVYLHAVSKETQPLSTHFGFEWFWAVNLVDNFLAPRFRHAHDFGEKPPAPQQFQCVNFLPICYFYGPNRSQKKLTLASSPHGLSHPSSVGLGCKPPALSPK